MDSPLADDEFRLSKTNSITESLADDAVMIALFVYTKSPVT